MTENILQINDSAPGVAKKEVKKKSVELAVANNSTSKDSKLTDDSEKNDLTQKQADDDGILKNPVAYPIWLSVSEAAKIGGVNTKTIRRAIQSEKIKYKIYKDRYLVGLRSLIQFLNSNKKLKNKLNFNGIGQYVKEWRA